MAGGRASQTRGAGSSGGSGWSPVGNDSRCQTQNGSSKTVAVNGGASSNDLQCRSFGFTVPSDAVIVGFRVRIYGTSTASDATPANLSRVVLTDSAGENSEVKPFTPDAFPIPAAFLETLGGDNDTWTPVRSWTYSEVNASTFGANIRAQNPPGSQETVSVDYVEITVVYTTDIPSLDPGQDLNPGNENRPSASLPGVNRRRRPTPSV